MNIAQSLSKASSLSTLWLGLSTVTAGAAAAAMHGNLELLPLSVCLIFGLTAQFSINFLHRYTDEKHQFGENREDGISFESSPFSTLTVLKEATYGSALITAMVGLVIIIMGGPTMLLFGAALLLLALIINAGRYPLSRTPLGVGLTSMAYGPVGTLAVCFLQSQRESEIDFNWYDLGPALWIGLALGFFIGNWKIIYNYAHIDSDRKNNKRTLSATIGKAGSRAMIVVNALCGLAMIWSFCYIWEPEILLWSVSVGAVGVVCYTVMAVSLKRIDDAGHQVSAPGGEIHFSPYGPVGPDRLTPSASILYKRLLNYAGALMFLLMMALFIIYCFTGNPFDTHLTITGTSSFI